MRQALRVLAASAFCALAHAQTTQALISGRIVDSVSGQAVAGASVTLVRSDAPGVAVGVSGSEGYFALPLLSPGVYRLRVLSARHQAQEKHELVLDVAARLDLDIRLRPLNDVWEAGLYRSVFLPGTRTLVTFYGPDVDSTKTATFEAQGGRQTPLESTISEVIGRRDLFTLPLQGRDTYTMLVTQPGVTADQATGRGLGLSVNGQRPTASNFLLDGLENNNYLTTGPLTPLAPELVQEYRLSTNNFSAQFGRTSGFIANAITHSGTPRFHGLAYVYFKNDALNGNDFQRNLRGLERTPIKEAQSGLRFGGPILRERLFFSSSFEQFRARSRLDAVNYLFPTATYIRNLPAGSLAREVLTRYAPPRVESATRSNALQPIAPPASIDRSTPIQRFDYRSRRDQIAARISAVVFERPDFVWSPYRDFTSPLKQTTIAAALSDQHTFSASLTNEARAGYSTDDLSFDRARPDIPTLTSNDGTSLPGARAFFPYRNRNGTWQFLDNLVWSGQRHLISAGAGLLLRTSRGILAPGRDGQYFFSDLNAFALDRPLLLQAAVDRQTLPATRMPDSRREYRYTQSFFYIEDTFKVLPRLTVNLGLRYENFGAPVNTGAVKDARIELGDGANFTQRLAAARFVFPSADENQSIFAADHRNWAPRAGFSWDVTGSGRTLVRGSGGFFYDRPFDNLWQLARVTSISLGTFRFPANSTVNYLAPLAAQLPDYASLYSATAPPNPTMFQTDMRGARVFSAFLGVERRLASNLTLEVNGLMALGRRLITTDVINRAQGSTVPITRNLPSNISYRANQGSSNYHALTASLQYRGERGRVGITYTWSHSIDNQSDPLRRDLLDYGFTSSTGAAAPASGAGFGRQFDSAGDRGNSDFDQRHNFVYYGVWSLPSPGARWAGPFRDWTVSGLGAFRSGFPYSVFGLFGRANLLDPSRAVLDASVPVAGGRRLLDRAAFGPASTLTPGNSGRNAFRGPGFYNLDVSVSRQIAVPGLGEAARLTLRADAYNVLNHANLNNPATSLGLGDFGVATYGRAGFSAGFPSLNPLNESARQVQLVLRVEF